MTVGETTPNAVNGVIATRIPMLHANRGRLRMRQPNARKIDGMATHNTMDTEKAT